MNRRQFFLSFVFQVKPTTLELQVMEVFSGSDGPSAFLVHHSSDATRSVFAQWLRVHDGARIACRLRNGMTINGQIFRVKLCFGRGLLLTRTPVAIRAGDLVSIN